MRKHRSRSRQGTDESRMESQGSGSAPGEPRPTPTTNGPATSPERAEGPPGEASTKGASQGSAQGDDAAKKSRSRRRRERRKEAKSRGDGQPAGPRPEEPEAAEAPAAQAPRQKEARPPRRDETRQREGPKPQRASRGEDKPRGQQRRDEGKRQGKGRREDRPFRAEGRSRERPDQGRPDFVRPDFVRPDHPRQDYARPERRPQARPAGLPEGLPFDDELELPPGFRGPMGEPIGRPGGRGVFSKKSAPAVGKLEALSPSAESLSIMERLEAVIEEAAPLQAKYRAGLKGDIRGLWEDLTSDRESRSVDYLGTPPALSAYLRYFMPWNVFRLSAIFSNADFCLPDNAVVVDIGSGPLTLPIALYASRPELREVPLTIYCMDRVERVLEAGKAIFETLCLRTSGRLPPWRIELKKEGFGGPLPERAHLLAAANVFNEFFWKDKRPLGERAIDTSRALLSYLRENGSLFVMEPGDPRSGAFIAALRAALIAEGASPLGPCPHALSCPMPGIFRHLLPPEETRVVKGDPNAAPSRFVLPPVVMPKKRDKFPWCHFGVDTDRAPAWLQALSQEAGLPKERAVMSYLWAARGAMARPPAGIPDPMRSSEKERRARVGKGILVRVVSEPFALPEGATGQYACTNLGYTLLKRPRGEDSFEPGDLLEVATAPLQKYDEKSGAIVLPT